MATLTARGIADARFEGKPRKLFDGGGLYLHLTRTGRKRRFAYRMDGRERAYTIGSADTISLAAARRMHQEVRAMVANGVDPVADRERLKSERVELAEARNQAMTTGKLVFDWLTRKKGEIASWARTESNLRHLRTDFLDVRVVELTPRHVSCELQAIVEWRSADVAHRALTCLRSALDDVLDDFLPPRRVAHVQSCVRPPRGL